MQNTSEQQLVENFLRDFVDELTQRYPDEIDFILLFGSAARGEWKRGISDVDLIIGVKKKEDVGPVRVYAEKLFWDLIRSHAPSSTRVCQPQEGGSRINARRKANPS